MDSRKQFEKWFSKRWPEFQHDKGSAFECWQAGRASMLDDGVTDDKWACHIDLEDGQEPDNCVLDGGYREHCFYARKYGDDARKHCGEWRPITIKKTKP